MGLWLVPLGRNIMMSKGMHILKKRCGVSVIFLQICFYESRDSLGQNSLHPKLWIINFVYPYESGPFIETDLGNKTLAYLLKL